MGLASGLYLKDRHFGTSCYHSKTLKRCSNTFLRICQSWKRPRKNKKDPALFLNFSKNTHWIGRRLRWSSVWLRLVIQFSYKFDIFSSTSTSLSFLSSRTSYINFDKGLKKKHSGLKVLGTDDRHGFSFPRELLTNN